MRSFAFSKFSPSGNTTLFLHAQAPDDASVRSAICRQAISHCGICAEQAGFADVTGPSLVMAAGEFCVNACRAFGALLDCQTQLGVNYLEAPRNYSINVSGYPSMVELLVEGKFPSWHVSATFRPESISFLGSLENGLLANLPGITHLLLQTDEFPSNADTSELARKMRQQYALESITAAGVVWWRPSVDGFEIWPYVHVCEAGTSMLESACGSATMALAIALCAGGSPNTCVVRQPCGEILSARVQADRITIAGNVTLAAQGEIWISENCSLGAETSRASTT